jgi:hypothetical protein
MQVVAVIRKSEMSLLSPLFMHPKVLEMRQNSPERKENYGF